MARCTKLHDSKWRPNELSHEDQMQAKAMMQFSDQLASEAAEVFSHSYDRGKDFLSRRKE
jgi:hypothetical protein